METRTIEVETPDGPMDLYEAWPDDGEERAAIIVIQEAFGVNEHIEDVTRRLADARYHAVAPHLFHRAGGGTAPYDDFSQVFPKFEGLDDDGLLRDFDATLDHLHEAGWTSGAIGAVGFCFGGRASFLLALRRALGASVGFYGGGIVSSPFWPPLVGEAASLQTPWLGLFGDKDESIPVDDVETLRQALDGVAVDTEIVRYPDAGHGFHCDVRTTHYNAEAAADGWARTLAWFDQHLGG